MNESSDSRQDTGIPYKGKHLHFYVDKSGWEYVHRPNSSEGVTIVAVTPAKEILFVEQYRIPIGANVIELPAGLVGDVPNDTPEKAAKRELREEIAYECDTMELVCKGPALPGLSDELNWFCVTHDARRRSEVEPGLSCSGGGEEGVLYGKADEGEAILRHEVALAAAHLWLREQVRQGKVVDLKVYAGLYLARQRELIPNKIFAAVDTTNHVYTWDYSESESASQIYDLSDRHFALITSCHDVDDETGAMGDYRSRRYKRCRLYSKYTLRVEEAFEFEETKDPVAEIANRLWGNTPRKTDTINLAIGKVSISGKDLILEE